MMSLFGNQDSDNNSNQAVIDEKQPFFERSFVEFLKEQITIEAEKRELDNLEDFSEHEINKLKLDLSFQAMTGTPFSTLKECVNWGDNVLTDIGK